MKSASSSTPFLLSSNCFLILCLATGLVLTTSCGSGPGSNPPKPAGNTSVNVLVSSTANDQVTRFAVGLQTLTLTSQSGSTVTLLSSQQPAEFMHLNGGIEPLTTVTIPQDIYTSAAVTLGGSTYVCLGQVPGGGLEIANDSVVTQSPTVTLPSPITVAGSSMALELNMQVYSSAIFPTCYTNPPFEGFSNSPTFNLAPINLSSSPTNPGNGKIGGLKAIIASMGTGASSLTLTIPGGPFGTRTLSATSNTSTVFQGISGASALTPGMFLDVDGAIQSDGSLLATRIAVENPSAVNLLTGPVMSVESSLFQQYGRTELGPLLTINSQSGIYSDINNFDFSNAVFETSGAFTNLPNLPFVFNFSASSIVAGQNVDITPATIPLTGGDYPPANTITLVPQTIDGTVTASQQTGTFTDYTVSLASYDLFATLAAEQGQTSPLNNPGQVEVYVDSSTQLLNSQTTLASGSVLRFFGLVFNDNGTLRMDCAQVNDGIMLSPQTTANAHPRAGEVHTSIQAGPEGMRPTVSVTQARP
jgi:hypothetical protein